MPNPTQRHILGFFLALTAAVMWGILPVALKELLTAMDTSTIIWYRFLVAGIVLGFWLAFKKDLPGKSDFSKHTVLILLIATLGLSANYFFFTFSLNFVNGETSEVVIQLSTLFLMMGGVFIYKESFVFPQKIGVLLILSGLLLFFNERLREFMSFENRETIGVIIVVLAALTWTVYALLQKKLFRQFSSVKILFLIYLCSVPIIFPFTKPLSALSLTAFEIGLLTFCCLNTLIAYGCFAEALNCWDASKVSAVLTLAPLFTISFLKILVIIVPTYEFTDRLGLLSIIGAILLVMGSVLTALVPAFQRQYSELKK